MSSNNTQATVNTLIPKISVTDFEVSMLKEHGFDHEDDGNDKYYFFAEDSIIEEVDRYENISSSEIKSALKIPENKTYFNEDNEISNNDYLTIFQNIVTRSDELTAIKIEGAYTCSRMEPDQFGGFINLITKNDIITKSTSDLMREAYEELKLSATESEEPQLLSKKKDTGGNNDFIMDDTGGSIWIEVGDVSLYILPNNKCGTLMVNAFRNDDHGGNPIDSMHVDYIGQSDSSSPK